MSRRESNLSRTVFLQNRIVSCIFSHQIIDFLYSPIFPPTAKNVAKMPTKKSANANNCRTLNVSKITAIFLQQKCSSHERLTLRMELWHQSHWLQRANFMNNQSESGCALLHLHPAGSGLEQYSFESGTVLTHSLHWTLNNLRLDAWANFLEVHNCGSCGF